MIRFYNTFSRKKEDFISIKKDEVKIYSCGPTVYSTQHIGNMRAGVAWDILKRVLRYFKYDVVDVTNITDVGHLVSDDNDGEDKMLKAAKKENKDPYQIAKYYEEIYKNDLLKLNVILSKFMPRATENITEQLKIIEDLEKAGYVYQIFDGIYFDVSKFKDYGKLSGQSLNDKKAGARVEEKTEKRNPQDFALWKFLVGDNKNHIMAWDSKWGRGFPGWHIECSAMSNKYLGNEFDIHTGGIEHIPIHHENEIAQNVCSGAVKKINYWLHNDHLIVDGEKMSKSIGNVYNLSDLVEKGYSPLALRELMLRTHYRKTLNFTFTSLDTGEINVKKINDFYSKFKQINPLPLKHDKVKNIYSKNIKHFEDAISDDLNIPVALSVLYEFMNEVNKEKEFSENDTLMILEFMQKTDEVFGLLIKSIPIPQEVVELAKKRIIARENKDWSESDRLRDEIIKLGYNIRDSKETKEGYILDKL